ncbi:DUF4232 domain-containing protein [Streptomyces ficellus]|uniref:DUF4232 domain-containing protein n=1 Tax=Streptomyces ficellus TaxID=1977088 RepID=A0ABT7YZ67_9ACTN|nr:DUF4232 domain-containing protein [Streptomyces ficellus]MDN3292538.1 DUF4232 domain-containing protein [Streptomyces ficellus]
MRAIASRTLSRARTAGLVLAVPLLAITTVGCGNGGKAVEGAQADRSAAARASAAPAAAGTGVARCRAAQLKADIQIQQEGSAMLMLTNKSARTCTVKGYPAYSGLAADNSPLSVRTKRVAHPGAPMLVTLKPGRTAFAGLKWTSCDKADEKCNVLSGVVVTPPGDKAGITATVLGTDGKPVKETLEVSAEGFTTGSLQPASQSVLFP